MRYLVGVAAVAGIGGFTWAVVVFTPTEFARGVQFGLGFLSVSGVFGSVVFLVRKRLRVRGLRWRIETTVKSIELNHRLDGLPKGEGADAMVRFLREQGTALLPEASGTYQALNELAEDVREYKFWGRVLRFGRRPEPLWPDR